MHFGLGNKSVFLLFFFLYGLIFTIILGWSAYRNQLKSSAWLSLFLFLCCMYICPFMCGYAGWYSITSHRLVLFFVPFQQLFLLGPILYFYTRSLAQPDFSLSFRDALHFVPAILYGIYTLIVFIGDWFIFDEFYFYADERDKDLDFWYQMTGLISMLYYLWLSLDGYRRYKKRALETLSYADAVLFRWMPRYLITFSIILILRVVFFILNPEWGEFGRKFWYYACFSVLFFYIAIYGFAHSIRQIVSFALLRPEWEPDEFEPQDLELSTSVNPSVKEQQIDLAFLSDWKHKIEESLLQDRLFRDPQLTLDKLAKQLDTNPKVISQVVNQGFEMNFNDFINQRRVEAVVQKMKAGEHIERTLLSLAYDCGFNSKSTFNRAFKKYKGSTPMQFIKDLSY